MKDSELRMIETMLKKQDELNSAIMKEYGLATISKEQIDLATLDEIGEFTHELKGDWCWWKKSQEPVDVDKVIEEYIDVVHFALMYEIKFGSGKWIPFTFDEEGILNCELPDIDEDILVWDMDGTFDKENVWVDTWESPYSYLYELESGMDLDGLAWMPLPKAYKEKENA